MKKDGGWVFISHSHLDIDIVRKIRNQLEARGFEPLMFFLKCLNDDDEIEELIQREIDEREWFIYVESENSANSKWVKSELEYISSIGGKKVFTIDINQDITKQIDAITKQLKVFISYSREDRALYESIKQALLKKDLLVFDDNEMPVGTEWSEHIRRELDATTRNGFVLLLVTENVKDSNWIKKEVEYTIAAGGKIVPIYVGNASLDDSWLDQIRELQGIHLDTHPTEEQIEKIVSHIETRIKYYELDFTLSCGFQGARSIHYPFVASITDYTFWDCAILEKVYIPSSVSYISDLAFRKDQDVLIICDKGSYAEQYCIKRGMRYKLNDRD